MNGAIADDHGRRLPVNPAATAERDGAPPLPAAAARQGDAQREPANRGRVRRWVARRALRLFMSAYEVAMAVAGAIGRRRREIAPGEGCEILLTGTFYSDNWIGAHLRPLAAAERVACVTVVSTYPIPDTPKVVAIYPPGWMRRIIGGVPARMATFAWIALRRRPHYVGGFHLLLNGMLAALVGRLAGARSIYFCVGGPMEVLDGGIWAENRLFGRLETPDAQIEQRLIRLVNAFNLVITMGTRAIEFFRERGVRSEFHVVSGGINETGYAPAAAAPTNDLVIVGRLAQIKRMDIFLQAVGLVREAVPGVCAVIVGDGERRESLESLATKLGLSDCVTFAGHQSDVASWLKRSRVFVLSSDSEGLALSLMEAMMCGLPAVVSDVGDLGDLVRDGENGYLVPPRQPQAFAEAIVGLLTDEQRLATFSKAARRDALEHTMIGVSRKWDRILGGVRQPAAATAAAAALESEFAASGSSR